MGIIRRHRILIAVLLGVLVCVCIAIYLLITPAFQIFRTFTSNSCPSTESAAVENFGKFVLPPSANNLWSMCWGMQGWAAYARFEMLPSDLDALVEKSLVDEPLSATQKPDDFYFPNEDVISIDNYLYGKYAPRDLEISQEILVDMSNPAQYVVYIKVLGG